MPTDTGFSITVPFVGARTVASSSLTLAIERFVRALISAELAFAKSSVAASISCAVMIFSLYSSAERLRCASAVALCTVAELTSAAAWSYWFWTSRGSICTSRSPVFTFAPMSTGMRVIVPDAFDFTSTMLTGSTVPFA